MDRRRPIPVAALVTLGSLAFALTVRADDWPQWRGPGRDGVWSERGIMETFPAGGLPIVWRSAVAMGQSSPAVAKGRVYVTDVQFDRPAARERVVCFDAATGKPLWTHKYDVNYPDWAFTPDTGGPRATPIVADGKVYTLGAMGHLHCLDAASGQVIWLNDLDKDYGVREFTGISASPLIEGDLLILYMCGKPAACVVAFNKSTGKEVWRALDDPFTYSSPIVFTAGGQRQLVVWTQEAVTSLDPATGKTWWREVIRTPGDVAVATPVYDDHRLLVGGLMFKLDKEKPAATTVWPESKAVMKRVLSNTSTPLLKGDEVFSARVSGELICLDAATGKQLWSTDKVTELKGGGCIHLTPTGDSVLMFTDQGNLIRAKLTRAGYEEIARAHLLDPTHPYSGRKVVWPPPAYADGHIFARSERELVCASLEGKAGK